MPRITRAITPILPALPRIEKTGDTMGARRDRPRMGTVPKTVDGSDPSGVSPPPLQDAPWLLRVGVLDLALRGLLKRHRQIVLRPRLDERGQELIERAFAELVVVVVDLPSTLRSDDHERVARVDVLEQAVDAGMDHGREMLPAAEAPLAVPAKRPCGLCPCGRLNTAVRAPNGWILRPAWAP